MTNDHLWFILESTERGKNQRWPGFPARIEGDRYFSIKRKLAGKLRVTIYQNWEGDKEMKVKVKKGNFPNQNERKRPFQGTCHLVYFKLKKRTGRMKKASEQARLPARISHTLTCVSAQPGRRCWCIPCSND